MAQGGQNCIGHVFRVCKNVVVPEPNQPPAARFQPSGAARVGGCVGVLAAVGFDDPAGGGAGEVGDKGADRVLAAKFVIMEAASAEKAPEGVFRVGWVTAEEASMVGHV